MSKGRTKGRRGFTLVEVVVTVGIVAALAAVIYPTVVRQFDAADPARAAEDLSNIRTAIETFGVNVRPHQPRDIEDLVNKPITGDVNALGVAYALPPDSAKWMGPYISASVLAAAAPGDQVITTGYGATISNTLPLFDIAAASQNGGDTVAVTGPTAAADFVSVMLAGLSGTAFNALNLIIDGPNESDVVLRRTSGRMRCPYAGAAPNNSDPCPAAFFLASPLRQ